MVKSPLSLGEDALVILDFEDSFTYNIASELYALGLSATVIPFAEILPTLQLLLLFHQEEKLKKTIIIYGPGPGHPDEYQVFYPYIDKLLQIEEIFHLGICLGHQILWNLLGGKIKRCAHPIHGQSVPLIIPAWKEYFEEENFHQKVEVQKYNSLQVDVSHLCEIKNEKLVYVDQELMMGKFLRGLTYQFHPESIGTSHPSLFFAPLFKFLNYNKSYGSKMLNPN